MEYENPEIPEGINVTRTHPLKEFLSLVIAVIVFISIIVLTLSLLVEKLATYVPFSIEQDVAGNFIEIGNSNAEIQNYLQNMADRLSDHMDLSEDIEIKVHYIEDDVKNAFATLGGHVFIHKGLLSIMPNENALAMVIGHEIGHIKHRHPIISMGRGVVIGLFLVSFAGLDTNLVVGDITNSAGTVALLKFSRNQETQADREGISAVVKEFGHANGADGLFKALMEDSDSYLLIPEFLSTHPFDQDRIKEIREFSLDNDWSLDSPTKSLPDLLK